MNEPAPHGELDGADESRWIVLGTLLCEGALVLLALGIGWFLPTSPWENLNWRLDAVAVGLVAAAPPLLALLLISRYPLGPFQHLQRVTAELVVPLFRDCSPVQLLAIAAMAGIGEELLFRGALQSLVQYWGGSPWASVLLVAGLFGAVHPITPLYAVLAGLIGVYLGWLLLVTDSLLAPIVTHAAYDLGALVYLLRRNAGSRPRE
jgi:membrane protease YdiL (CAAX protease family)